MTGKFKINGEIWTKKKPKRGGGGFFRLKGSYICVNEKFVSGLEVHKCTDDLSVLLMP
jgi:hypothetical protein